MSTKLEGCIPAMTKVMAAVMEGTRSPRGDEKNAGMVASWGRRAPSGKNAGGTRGGPAGSWGAGGRDIPARIGWVVMQSEDRVGDDATISSWAGCKIRGWCVSRDERQCERSFVGKHE